MSTDVFATDRLVPANAPLVSEKHFLAVAQLLEVVVPLLRGYVEHVENRRTFPWGQLTLTTIIAASRSPKLKLV